MAMLDKLGRALRLESLENRITLDAAGIEPPPDAMLGSTFQLHQAVGNGGPETTQPIRGTLEYQVVSDWGSGFTGAFQLTNSGGTAWDDWTVAFDADFEITSIWNATIVAREGNRYTISAAEWNRQVAEAGTVSFGIVGKPNRLDSATGLTNITIQGNDVGNPNTMPLAVDDAATTVFQTTLQLNVLANDSDPDGDPLTVTAVGDAAYGVVSFQANGLITYTPDDGYIGVDAFLYSISDGRGGAASGLVSITVEPGKNNAPVTAADQVDLFAESPTTIDVLANDFDPDGDVLQLLAAGQGEHGSVSLTAEGWVLYIPRAGFVGTDAFEYRVSDGELTATGRVQVNVRDRDDQNARVWPDRFFAPYVDATLTSGYSLVDAAREYNVKFFTLAFVVADPSTNQPSWGGYYDVAEGYRKDEIQALRGVGGDVMLSFGGAANTELAVAITDVDELTAAYQSVIDAYQLTYIDFDIEGAWLGDRASVDRRSLAIRNLQDIAVQQGRPLEVWYTLPVLPTGLTLDGVYVLESALNAGVDIAGVNVMAMNFGSATAPNPEGQMGRYAIQAGESIKSQLEVLYRNAGMPKSEAQLYRMVGVTPMIGQNDLPSERFYQEDAQELLAWAEANDIGMLSMWSATRDMSGSGLSPLHSGIAQTPGEFHTLLAPFTGDSEPSIRIADASMVEGDGGVTRLAFSVTLDQRHDAPVRVEYATQADSATVSDFVATSGTLVFAPGETEKTIFVDIVGDSTTESDEQFTVQLAQVSNAKLREARATGTIVDDDTLPVVTINDVQVVEDSAEALFTVTLSRPPKPGESFRVDYSTRDGSANHADYLATAGTLIFAAGQTQQIIRVAIISETSRENDETFEVVLATPTAIIGDGIGVATILDDDTPTVQVSRTIQSDWGTGYTASTTIVNTIEQALVDWRLEFTYAGEITSIWNATILERDGDRYVIAPVAWTREIGPGSSILFGYEASGDSSIMPSDVRLNGQEVEIK